MEFGHKIWLDEGDGGIVTAWRVLDSNPPDEEQWRPVVDHHLQQFDKPPCKPVATEVCTRLPTKLVLVSKEPTAIFYPSLVAKLINGSSTKVSLGSNVDAVFTQVSRVGLES